MAKIQYHFPRPQNMKPYLVVGLGFLVVVITIYQLASSAPGSLLDAKKYDSSKQVAADDKTVAEERKEFIENLDSDSDGLTDVEEEQVYQTDPSKPDTDGDGFNDGVEIQNNYDPRVDQGNTPGAAASGDQKDSDYYDYNRSIAKTPDDLSNIDPSKYLSEEDINKLKKGETPDNIEDIASLALANTAISEDKVLPEIKDSELNIIDASGKSAVQQYVMSVVSIFLQDVPVQGQEAFIQYAKSVVTGDTEKILESVNLAKQGVEQLKAVPVPREMLSIHKRAIGILEVYIESSTKLLNKDKISPQDGLQAINNIRVITRALEDLMKEIFDKTNRYGINFSL